VIPTIAIVGIAGLASTWWLGARAREEGAEFDGDLWRMWGRVGTGLSLLAYLAEYAPHHIGMRLEVNHPFYAMTWLGGGELIAMIGEWRVARIRPPAWRIVLAVLAFVAAPLALVVGGARVFIPLDSRVAHLHETISEFRSVVSLVRAHEWHTLARYAIAVVLLIPALLAFKERQRDRVLIAFAAFTAVGCAALAFWQVRWWLLTSGPELCLLLLVVAMLVGQRSVRVRWAVVLSISAVFAAQAGARIRLTRSNVATGAVSEADATEPLYRDVAAVVRTSQPAGDVVLLASPNASTGIGYFGRFKTLGTLYWENADGLGAAAAIYSARTDDEARRLLADRSVTHIAMIGGGEYLLSYFAYAHPGAQRDELAHTFGARLQAQDIPPRWLRAVPLRARAGSQPASLTARILQVVPEQTEFEALWSDAVARAAAGEETTAAQEFQTAIALAPAAQRAELMEQAATAAYRWHAHHLALAFFGATASSPSSKAARVAAAWILAVSADDSVRNGNAAMEIIRPLAEENPNDPAILDALAAALAETGHFPDAISVAERVVLLYRTLGDVGAETRARAHLDSYRASRPWRV
jgi:tetratricopeptide (TPR) repeat protein